MEKLLLEMLQFNIPLSRWESYTKRVQGAGFFRFKNTDKVAQSIFTQLSHEKAVELVAREWEDLPAEIRLRVGDLCNQGNGSGNVRKGVQRLNNLIGGKLLREQKFEERFQVQTRDGSWTSKKVNPAVSGATRKYGVVK